MTKQKNTWVEEFEVSGREVVGRVRELVQQGNVRRLIVRKKNGDVVIDLPLTASVVGASALTVFASPLVVLGAVAALVAELRIEVLREDEDADDDNEPPPNIRQKIDVE